MIPHSRPTLDEEDAAATARVVLGGVLAQGPEVAAFEQALGARLGVEACAAVSSGTTALELALRALDVGAGDEVLIPTFACDALYHAVHRCGAAAVPVDADPETLTMSANDATRRLGARTRALVVPHAFGLAIDLEPFLAFGLPVVEDCAQALGARAGGRPAGALGSVSVCSFYATKLMTTGEGGLVAGPRALVARVVEARDYDERTDLGFRMNAKMTDLQAALGRSQLRRLDGFLERRRAIAARYRARLAGLGCGLPPDVGERHVYHRFVVAVPRPVDGVIARFDERGVVARRPVHRPLHRALGIEGFPEAERLWACLVSLPCYPTLTDDEVDRVAATLAEALAEP